VHTLSAGFLQNLLLSAMGTRVVHLPDTSASSPGSVTGRQDIFSRWENMTRSVHFPKNFSVYFLCYECIAKHSEERGGTCGRGH